MKGQWFPGWGYMRFWNSEQRASMTPKGSVVGQSDGEGLGEDQLFKGRANYPRAGHASILGASPVEMRLEWAKRRALVN